MSFKVNQGTQTDVYSLTNAGTEIPVIKLDMGAGTALNSFSGTIPEITNIVGGTLSRINGTLTEVANVAKGTITRVENGTINGTILGGTVNAGTVQVNMTPTIIGTSLHTRGTSGAAVWGTLVAAAGAGTRQYVSGVDIVVAAGTVDVVVTNIGVGGSTGAGVLARGQFTPGGGIRKAINPVSASGANGTLAFWMGGAGTVDIVVDYWQGV